MRSYLKKDTWVRFPGGECYKIIAAPIGEGGGSLIYPVVRQLYNPDGTYRSGELKFALKECFPVSSEHIFIRSENGEIIPETDTEQSKNYLKSVQKMQMDEQEVTGKIYNTAFRLTPILGGSTEVDLSFDNGITYYHVHNTVTIMESLSNKGKSLKSYLNEQKKIPASQAFRVIEQILLAVKEVHKAGYLHLDIQDGNVFIKGSLSDQSDLASLIDFGSSRKLLEDNRCKAIEDRVIFSTQGFAAPEMSHKNDGTLRLGPEADIYSIGYLLLLLLTGQKYSAYELYSNTDGHYLTKFKLRKINCPRHLVEKMQQILARALENEPENRYHSCDEMLADISDFVKALQPYRSDLSQVSYDAFICYRHGPIDSVAARVLQERLEHFRAPRVSGEGKKKIQRVFVDEGELSSCADFGLQIREALKNAGWLIVICSPETKNSPWVNLEIKTFLEFHDRSRILAVMTSGEPAEIFPEALLGKFDNMNDILAADARGDSLKQVLKKLKKDALLRIAAPILGTTYDSLKQRRHTYVFRRIATVSIIAVFLLSGFTAYVLWQAEQMNEQYQQTRRNQARYLSSLSLDCLNRGERDKALLTALSVAPEDDSEGPVVPEQMYVLNRALTSYKSGLTIKYDPAFTGEIEGFSSGSLSPEGSYYAAIDKKNNVVFLSGETGKLQWTLTPDDIKDSIDNLYPYQFENFEEFESVLPISEEKAAVIMSYCISVVDVISKKTVNTFPLEESFSASTIDLSGNLIAWGTYGGNIYVYDLYTGKPIYKQDLNEEIERNKTEYQIEDIMLDDTGNSLAVGLSYSYKSDSYISYNATDQEKKKYEEESEKWFSKHSPTGLMIYTFSDKSTQVLTSEPTIRVHFTDDTCVAALHSADLTSEDWMAKQTTSFSLLYHAAYDLPSGTCLFQSNAVMTRNFYGNAGFKSGKLKIDGDTTPVLINWLCENLTVINLNSGQIITEFSYDSDIINSFIYDESHLLIGLEDGTVLSIAFASTIKNYTALSLSIDANQFQYNKTQDVVIFRSDGNLIFCTGQGDQDMKSCLLPDCTSKELQIDSINYVETSNGIYRCICLECESYHITKFLVYPVGSKKCIYQYQVNDMDDSINNIGFGTCDETVYICFTVKTANKKIIFYKVDIFTGELIIQEDVTSYDSLEFSGSNCLIYTSDMKSVFVKRSQGVVRFDISGKTMVADSRAILPNLCIQTMRITGSGKYLVLSAEGHINNRMIYLYNIAEKSIAKAEFGIDFSYNTGSNFITTGTDSDQIALYDGGEQIYIVDCNTQSIRFSIPAKEGYTYQMAFFEKDQYFFLLDQSLSTLTMYYLGENDISVQYSYTLKDSGSLITDSNSNYFALMGGTNDNGSYIPKLYLFYIDEKHQFYPFAEVEYGYASPAGEEICSMNGTGFAFQTFYNYQQLKDKALKALDGKELSDKEKREYFIAE